MALTARELRQVESAERRDCGQVRGSLSGVAAQSRPRISAPISPPPARKPNVCGTVLLRLEGCRSSSVLRILAPLPAGYLRVLQHTEGSAHDLAGAAVAAGRDTPVDEGFELGREGHVAGLAYRHRAIRRIGFRLCQS